MLPLLLPLDTVVTAKKLMENQMRRQGASSLRAVPEHQLPELAKVVVANDLLSLPALAATFLAAHPGPSTRQVIPLSATLHCRHIGVMKRSN